MSDGRGAPGGRRPWGPALFSDAVGAPVWFVGAGAAMIALAALTWAIPSIRHIED